MGLICADVLRPDMSWLASPATPKNLTVHLARTRDPQGWARLRARCDADPASRATKATALCRIAVLQAAKGGTLAEITVGDCLELLQAVHRIGGGKTTSGYFYQLLHAIGIFEPAAPATVRAFSTTGQLSIEDLIDRYRIACRPVRNLFVDYLREGVSTVDYVTLQRLATTLAKLFWADLEQHHPGIDSLRLAPEAAAGWKQRVLTRESGLSTLSTVRAFYLDLAQWAMEEPARWGPWAAPCPIRAEEMSRTKSHRQRKSRMDQRTRERLPVLPGLVAAVATERRTATDLLAAARATRPARPSLPLASPCAGPSSLVLATRPRPGLTTPTPAPATTSLTTITRPSGPGPPSKYYGIPACGSRNSASCRITASCNTPCPAPANSFLCCTSLPPKPTASGCS